jgi:DNA-binding SARP family transcriptional activator
MTTATKTPKLWEISEEVNRLEQLLCDIEEREDLTESEREGYYEIVLNDWLSTGKEFDDKACNVAAYIKHLEALAEARKNEYRRLRDLAEQSDKQAQRLRNYLIQNMQKLDKKKVNGINASLSLRKKPAKVTLNCPPEDLPAKFMKVEITPRLSEIKKHIQSNPDCAFAQLSDTEEYSVIIK